jgi:hypothetical protein
MVTQSRRAARDPITLGNVEKWLQRHRSRHQARRAGLKAMQVMDD